jgi:hypothetical protein
VVVVVVGEFEKKGRKEVVGEMGSFYTEWWFK